MLLAIYAGTVGALHFFSAILAMVAGAFVFFAPKATKPHRKAGYVYVAAMTVMLGTAFGIYNLYASFSVFHYLALFSTVTLVGGMVPVALKRPNPGYVRMHFGFMYWSVIGLYMAFVAETAVRITDMNVFDGAPTNAFWTIVAVSSGLVMLGANVYWFRNKKRWQTEFAAYERRASELEAG